MISDTSTSLLRRLPRRLSTAGTMLLVLILGVALTACGDDTGGMDDLQPPTIEGSIDNQSLVVNNDTDDTAEVDISGVFEGEELSFSASSSDTGVAAVSLDGMTLTVDPQNGGSATVTVTAENDAGSEDVTFNVNVDLPNAPDPPSGS